jgi:hypothetical protein
MGARLLAVEGMPLLDGLVWKLRLIRSIFSTTQMLHGLYPHHDTRFFDPRSTIRAPPRPQVASSRSTPTVSPHVSLTTAAEQHEVTLSPPDDSYKIVDAQASLGDDARSIVLEGSLLKKADGAYQYQTRRRAGVYSRPSQHALAGVLPPGKVVRGGAPTSEGWIALDEEEGAWMLDDGTLALVGRPAPSRPQPFAKHVALPADSEPRRATSRPLGRNRGDGGLIVSVPRTRRTPAPRPVPVNVHRRPPAQQQHNQPPATAPPKPSAKPAAKPAAKQSARPATAAHANDVSAEEYKRQHKRQAAERRGMHDALRTLLGDEAGALLVECDADDVSARNVQSPSEQVEEWVAATDGGFVRADDDDVVMCVWEEAHADTGKSSAQGKTAHNADGAEEEWDDMADDLAYWGF